MRTHENRTTSRRPSAQPVSGDVSREIAGFSRSSSLPTVTFFAGDSPENASSAFAPFLPVQKAVIQRLDWDPRDLQDKGNQKKNPFNSMAKSAVDSVSEKFGWEKLKRFGSVSTRLKMVEDALDNKDADGLIAALKALEGQFESGTPPHAYVKMRLQELTANKQAGMNTMLAYHNVNKAPYAKDAGTSDEAAALKAHILAAKDAYLSGDYPGAHKLLFDSATARQFGFGINVLGGPKARRMNRNLIKYKDVPSLVADAVPILESAMAWYQEGNVEIRLPYILPTKDGVTEENYYDIPELAKMAMPVYLEEWMHQYQRKKRQDLGIPETTGTGGFWSQNTADYFQPHQGTAAGKVGGINFNEIDILSAFHDWGFPVEELGTVGKGLYSDKHRYDDREQFWAWIKGG